MPTKKLKIHFIGIGGIGVSALARYYLAKGCKVTGSDLVASEITDSLKKLGAKIFIGPHRPRNVLGMIDLVVYSPAVQKSNPELKAVIQHPRLLNQPRVLSYPEALGELTKEHFTIAVSGTHGKSTTTAMIGLLLTKAGFDPTVIIGTKLKEFGDSNCRVGKSRYLVIEADEYKSSFLNYWPKIIVLTTIEADHLDYYKNLSNILKTFKKYIGHLPKDGVLIVNRDDPNVQKVSRLQPPHHPPTEGGPLDRVSASLSYSLKQKEAKKIKKILKIPGEHNIYNALAALTVARALKIPDKISFKSLSEYRGSWRRFEITRPGLVVRPGLVRHPIIISDYGHHPTEIRVTLKAAREKYPKKKIWCVFQPHQYQRTFYLFKDFVKVFRQAPVDKLIITDIYDVAGREEKEIKKKVNSEKLVKTVNKNWVIYLPKKDYNPPTTSSHSSLRSEWAPIINYLKKNLKGGEVVVIMGAGDIYNLAEDLTKIKKQKKIK